MARNNDVDFKVLIFLGGLIFVLVFIVRIYWVLVRRKSLKKKKVERHVKTMIVMGSGQPVFQRFHEMIRI